MMELLERAAARNLADYVAAYQRTAPSLGACSLPFAGGLAAFTGPRSPLTTIKGAGPEITPQELDAVEAFYTAHAAHAIVIEAAPWLSSASRRLLESRGYTPAGAENVVVCERPALLPAPRLEVAPVDPQTWAALVLDGFEMPHESPWIELSHAAANLDNAVNLAARAGDGPWIACAQLAPALDAWIFGCDATLPAARGRGAQAALILARLRSIPPAALAVAEVAPGGASERNYLRCGFRVAGLRTHYRRPLA